eukprot:3420022-Rhodomonas_salina.1
MECITQTLDPRPWTALVFVISCSVVPLPGIPTRILYRVTRGTIPMHVSAYAYHALPSAYPHNAAGTILRVCPSHLHVSSPQFCTTIWCHEVVLCNALWRSTLHSSPFTLHPSLFTLHPSPFTLHPSPYTLTLHPTPYTLHPSPFTLHPSPYTLHPTTLHPTPYSAGERAERGTEGSTEWEDGGQCAVLSGRMGGAVRSTEWEDGGCSAQY